MKKTSTVLTLFLILIMLTTFNPNNLNFGFHFFKVKKIEVKNLKILEKKKLENQFYNELSGSNLFILDEKKIEKVLNNNDFIDFLEFKKIFPYKLQIVVYEKDTIAILNYKRDKYYLTRSGEKIKFFKNQTLEKLPNIFGKEKNFLEVYSILKEINFPISKIKSFYYFDIGRWDILLENKVVIKLPVKNFHISLKNFMDLDKKINFEKYSIFDYRIKDQLILN
tara:strand:- start:127 stop:795 length:669 start_codon:yes stop_codon:yes gene_type:complete